MRGRVRVGMTVDKLRESEDKGEGESEGEGEGEGESEGEGEGERCLRPHHTRKKTAKLIQSMTFHILRK